MQKLFLTVLSTTVVVLYIIYFGWIVRIRPASVPQLSQSYHFPVGVTELKQCKRAFDLFGGKVVDNPVYSEFSHNVSLISVDADGGILLHVRETRNKTLTGGGSSLLAVSDDVRRRLCFYEDYFSGNYMIWCPPPSPGQCSKVSIEMKYANFSAYTIGYFPLKKGQIWEMEICWDDTARKPSYLGLDIPRVLIPPWRTTYPEAPHTCRIDWIRGAKGSIINDNDEEIPLLEDEEFCSRIRHFHRVIMIGASHMRYKFNYIALKCNHAIGPKERKHASTKVNGTIFTEVPYMAGIADLWTNTLEKINLTKYDAVIIQHGSHDLYSNKTRYVLSTSLYNYVTDLKAIKKHSLTLGFRFIAVTSPPFGDSVVRKKIDNRNNFTLAALARLLHKMLSAARIDIFDEFAVLLPYYNDDARPCVGHYLCPDRDNLVIRGHTGIVALHLLVRHLAGEGRATTC